MCIDERGRPVESRLVGQIGKGGPFLISPQPQQTAVLRQTGGPQRKARLLHEKRFCWRALSFNRIQRPRRSQAFILQRRPIFEANAFQRGIGNQPGII
jgi:hypothetical protein